jgi:hypothetical protein
MFHRDSPSHQGFQAQVSEVLILGQPYAVHLALSNLLTPIQAAPDRNIEPPAIELQLEAARNTRV